MTDDDRVTCRQCQNLSAGRCTQAKRAGLSQWASVDIGSAFAELPQRCPAFKAKPEPKAKA